MRNPVVVVAGWGLANGILLTVLALYGESDFTRYLYGSVFVLIELVALTVWLAGRRGPDQHTRYRRPAGGGGVVLPAAAGAFLVGLSFVYGWWMTAVAVPVWIVAAVLGVIHHRRRGGS